MYNCIKIDKICKAYNSNTVFKNFSLTLRHGESHCIMGSSGCGKTTLLHMLMGIVKPDAGTITGLNGLKPAPVFQENRLCMNLSAGANIRLAGGTDEEKALSALGLDGCLHTPVKDLSGGMARRVSIARALCSGGDLLLLDEPFKGLDGVTKEQVMNFAREKCAGKTTVWVTHDEREAAFWGGNIVDLGKKAVL